MRDTELFKARTKETESDYTLNNRSIPTAERRNFEALDALFRGDFQTALTRANNMIINNNIAILPTYYSK